MTISISILQTFRSWVATSHLRPPMAFLSHNSSDTPGLAPLMNVLFWGRCDLSNKLLWQGYDEERLKSSLKKFYGRYGDLTKEYEGPLSRMLHDILDDDHIQWHPPLIRHYTNFLNRYWSGPNYWIRLFTLLCKVSIEHICNGCGIPREDAYSSGHLVLSHFGTCMCSYVETDFSWTCLFPDFWISSIPRYFSFAFSPREDAEGLSREYVLRIPSVS